MNELIKKPSAWVPLAMSLAAISLVLGYVAIVGVVEAQGQQDEGVAARIFQLLLVGQVPVIAYFAASWVPKAQKQAIPILVSQLLAVVAALALIFFLEL